MKKTPSSTSKRLFTLIIWMSIAWLLFYISSAIYSSFTTINTPYTHFVENSSSITEVKVQSDGRTLTYKTEGYNGEVSGKTFKTVSPTDTSSVIPVLIESGTRVYAEPPATPSGMGTMLIMSIIPVLILVFFLFLMNKKSGSGLLAFGKSKARLVNPDSNKVRLTDIISNPGELDEAKEIINFLKNPDVYFNAKVKFPKGVLMSGSPGTGKTLLSRAIAGEAGVPFFEVSGSEFVEMFVGTGASRVRDMFEQAKAVAPSIIFIDEIDAVGRARSAKSSGSSNESDQTLNQLLVEMDGFDNDSRVIIIAATNRVDVLDSALLRPGRFDRIINVSLPDVTARGKILKLHLSNVNSLITDEEIERVARGTPGFSGAELSSLTNEGAIFAARETRTHVTVADLEKAKDKILMGAESPKKMNESELKLTAYHEAGHAIVGKCVPEYDSVYKVSIIPRGNALGVTQFLPDEDRYSHSLAYLNGAIATLFGGRIAEKLIYGENAVTTGASNDIKRATELARRMVTEWGFSHLGIQNLARATFQTPNGPSEATLSKVDAEVEHILNQNYLKAEKILKDNLEMLHKMAEELVVHETLDSLQINEITKGMNNG